MKKILNMIIEDTCEECPYLEYDPSYGMSYDSGYDCSHPDMCRRIIDDGMIKHRKEKIKEIEKSKQTLFPKPDDLKHPLSIPEWCPLKDLDPKDEIEGCDDKDIGNLCKALKAARTFIKMKLGDEEEDEWIRRLREL